MALKGKVTNYKGNFSVAIALLCRIQSTPDSLGNISGPTEEYKDIFPIANEAVTSFAVTFAGSGLTLSRMPSSGVQFDDRPKEGYSTYTSNVISGVELDQVLPVSAVSNIHWKYWDMLSL